MACSPATKPEPDVRIEVPHVPAYLRSCSPIPKAHADLMKDQGQAAVFVTRLHAVASECKRKLDATDVILTKAEAASVKQ